MTPIGSNNLATASKSAGANLKATTARSIKPVATKKVRHALVEYRDLTVG